MNNCSPRHELALFSANFCTNPGSNCRADYTEVARYRCTSRKVLLDFSLCTGIIDLVENSSWNAGACLPRARSKGSSFFSLGVRVPLLLAPSNQKRTL